MAKPVTIGPSFKILGSRIKNNIGLVFVVGLCVLFVCEALVIKNSLNLALQGNLQSDTAIQPKGIRIDFTTYDAVTKRINDNAFYQPPQEQLNNPFIPATAPTSPATPPSPSP